MNSMLQTLLLMIIIFSAPFIFMELRERKIAIIYWSSMFAREVFSFVHVYLVALPGIGPDYDDYHHFASLIAESGEWGNISAGEGMYENLLAFFYMIFGNTEIIFGFQISIVLFMLSCIILIKLVNVVGLSESKVLILALFALLPTSIMLGSVTMPESAQVFSFMLSVYFAIVYMTSKKIGYLLLFILSSVFLGMLHKGLFPFSIIMILIVTFCCMNVSGSVSVFYRKRVAAFFYMLLVTLPIIAYLIKEIGLGVFGALKPLLNMDLFDYLVQHRSSAINSRATYGVVLDMGTAFSVYYSSIMVVVHYLFEPFVWKIEGVMDIYASFESFLRGVLLISSVLLWRSASGENKRIIGFLLIIYLVITVVWAFGTTNYAQAIRHHMTHFWIIMVVGVPMVAARLRNIKNKYL